MGLVQPSIEAGGIAQCTAGIEAASARLTRLENGIDTLKEKFESAARSTVTDTDLERHANSQRIRDDAQERRIETLERRRG